MPNRMIYISSAVSEEFDKEENKSGLVNALLGQHYGREKKPEPGSQQWVTQKVHDIIPMKPKIRNLADVVAEETEDENDYYTNKVFDIRTNDIADTATGEVEQERDPEIVKELKRRGQTR